MLALSLHARPTPLPAWSLSDLPSISKPQHSSSFFPSLPSVKQLGLKAVAGAAAYTTKQKWAEVAKQIAETEVNEQLLFNELEKQVYQAAIKLQLRHVGLVYLNRFIAETNKQLHSLPATEALQEFETLVDVLFEESTADIEAEVDRAAASFQLRTSVKGTHERSPLTAFLTWIQGLLSSKRTPEFHALAERSYNRAHRDFQTTPYNATDSIGQQLVKQCEEWMYDRQAVGVPLTDAYSLEGDDWDVSGKLMDAISDADSLPKLTQLTEAITTHLRKVDNAFAAGQLKDVSQMPAAPAPLHVRLSALEAKTDEDITFSDVLSSQLAMPQVRTLVAIVQTMMDVAVSESPRTVQRNNFTSGGGGGGGGDPYSSHTALNTTNSIRRRNNDDDKRESGDHADELAEEQEHVERARVTWMAGFGSIGVIAKDRINAWVDTVMNLFRNQAYEEFEKQWAKDRKHERTKTQPPKDKKPSNSNSKSKPQCAPDRLDEFMRLMREFMSGLYKLLSAFAAAFVQWMLIGLQALRVLLKLGYNAVSWLCGQLNALFWCLVKQVKRLYQTIRYKKTHSESTKQQYQHKLQQNLLGTLQQQLPRFVSMIGVPGKDQPLALQLLACILGGLL